MDFSNYCVLKVVDLFSDWAIMQGMLGIALSASDPQGIFSGAFLGDSFNTYILDKIYIALCLQLLRVIVACLRLIVEGYHDGRYYPSN